MNSISATSEEILDRCIDEINQGRKSIEECLASYPQEREQLEPVLHVADRLAAAREVRVSDEFRLAAPTRMQNLIASRPRQALDPAPRKWLGLSRSLKLALASVLLVIVISTSGIIYASANSLPGHLLYPAKLSFESIQLSLSSGLRASSELHMVFADRRLTEAVFLNEHNHDERLKPTLSNYSEQVQSAVQVFNTGGGLDAADEKVLATRFLQNLDRHSQQLQKLLARVSADDREAVLEAIQASQAARQQAMQYLFQQAAPGAEPGLAGEGPTARPAESEAAATPEPTWEASDWTTAWATVYPQPGALLTGTPAAPRTGTAWAWPTGWPTEDPGDSDEAPGWATAWPSTWPTPPAWSTQWANPQRTPRPRTIPPTRPVRPNGSPQERPSNP